uniref:Uncharacterized protein n=1 Tax=Panagrolaimus sp. JU765 TaxID=591449 RepID=A0AC34PYR0_9BILA
MSSIPIDYRPIEPAVPITHQLINWTFICLENAFERALQRSADVGLNVTYVNFSDYINICGNVIYERLPLERYQNNDEIKYYTKPINRYQPCNIITLGIGRDVRAEMGIQKNYPQCRFLGVDVDDKVSGKMYKNNLGGIYVHALVSATGGNGVSSFLGKLTNLFKI